ncbi:unnamed protein product [Rotaria socialis]|uniref:6-phosphogluconate dehydrogenase n=1 Tax=Rotaria socialis TaxID=392032 RepID=A0A817T7V3_9BILA|nr:unnamed protein product [Rotaria socialis]CAF3315207.1 unnamed protein product [Rotaria socialis]CAF4137782.1 unnamed protein product [Rotaria socialis]CAF4263114.1 unnamed protein product [Rotaria socialis]
MAEKTTIAIMSPGDMGHAIGRALLSSIENKFRIITNLTERSERTQKLSNSAGIIDVKTDEEMIQQADYVFSIVASSQAKSLAQRFAPYLHKHKHAIYVDMNAIAPQTLCSIDELLPHGNFVDGSIIGLPPGTPGYSCTLYLSGEHAQKIADLFQYTNLMKVRVIGSEIGQASKLKMCEGSLLKGLTAIGIQAFIAAKSFGLDEILFDHLKQTMPDIFDKLSKFIPHTPPKAARWAGEMEEISKMFESVGLSSKIFQGATETYRFIAEETPLGNETIEDRKQGLTLHDAIEIMNLSLEESTLNK